MSGFFKKISNALGLTDSGGDSVIGLDIGSSSVKVVQLRKEKGVAILETYGEISLGPYMGEGVGRAVKPSIEKLTEAVGDLLREADVTTGNCGMTIPYSSSLVSFIEVPKIDKSKLNEMIPIEARKYVPVPMSEVTLDWFMVPQKPSANSGKEEKARTNVMLVAVHNNILDEYQEITKRIGLIVSFFEIEIFSVARAVMGRGMSPVMIIDMGSASTKLYIVERGVVKYSHSIGKGGQDITLAISRSSNIDFSKAEKNKRMKVKKDGSAGLGKEAEVVVNYILSEASKVLLNYQKKNKETVSEVVLSGGSVFFDNFIENTKEKLEAEVFFADPFSKVKTPAFLEDALKEAGPEFSASIGAALRKLEEVN